MLKRLRFRCENQIFPFFPRKWENCPYFSLKRFVIDLQPYYKQLRTVTFYFYLVVGILIVDCRLGL